MSTTISKKCYIHFEQIRVSQATEPLKSQSLRNVWHSHRRCVCGGSCRPRLEQRPFASSDDEAKDCEGTEDVVNISAVLLEYLNVNGALAEQGVLRMRYHLHLGTFKCSRPYSEKYSWLLTLLTKCSWVDLRNGLYHIIFMSETLWEDHK